MQVNLAYGERFGRVTFVGSDVRKHRYFDEDGLEHAGDRTFYKFKCDCGEKFEVMYVEWRGKRSTPDCGKCGLADRSEGRVTLIVAVKPDTAKKAKDTARGLGVGFSQWMRDCIQAGIDGRIIKGAVNGKDGD